MIGGGGEFFGHAGLRRRHSHFEAGDELAAGGEAGGQSDGDLVDASAAAGGLLGDGDLVGCGALMNGVAPTVEIAAVLDADDGVCVGSGFRTAAEDEEQLAVGIAGVVHGGQQREKAAARVDFALDRLWLVVVFGGD